MGTINNFNGPLSGYELFLSRLPVGGAKLATPIVAAAFTLQASAGTPWDAAAPIQHPLAGMHRRSGLQGKTLKRSNNVSASYHRSSINDY